MIRIALTGGIASGKSEVSRILREQGAFVVDHDILAREAVEVGTAGLAAIEREFGGQVIRADGSLDRAALGAIVFGESTKLRALNAIVHPEVKRLADLADEHALASGKCVVVHDIPLLAETSQAQGFDEVFVVEAPEVERVRRMMENRGMSEEDARTRIASQASDAQRRAIATQVLHNDAGLSELRDSVLRVWHEVVG